MDLREVLEGLTQSLCTELCLQHCLSVLIYRSIQGLAKVLRLGLNLCPSYVRLPEYWKYRHVAPYLTYIEFSFNSAQNSLR